MEQFLAAVRKYDPNYTEKMKQVVDVVNRRYGKQKQFSLADVNLHLEFDAAKYLRKLVRRKHLEKAGPGVFQRTDWPPPSSLWEGDPVGFTYCVQTWFPYYLQQWITHSMGELESKDGVYSLDQRGKSHDDTAAKSGLSIPIAAGAAGNWTDTKGGQRGRRTDSFRHCSRPPGTVIRLARRRGSSSRNLSVCAKCPYNSGSLPKYGRGEYSRRADPARSFLRFDRRKAGGITHSF